jgi:hypothetical protein
MVMRGRKTRVLPEKDHHKGVKCPDIPPNGGLTPSCRNFGDRRKEDLENTMAYLKKALKEGRLITSEIHAGTKRRTEHLPPGDEESLIIVEDTVIFKVVSFMKPSEYGALIEFRNLKKHRG